MQSEPWEGAGSLPEGTSSQAGPCLRCERSQLLALKQGASLKAYREEHGRASDRELRAAGGYGRRLGFQTSSDYSSCGTSGSHATFVQVNFFPRPESTEH